jgi:hypothetical protein
MQSVPITTDVVSSNLNQGEVYNIMWYILSVTCNRSVVFSRHSDFLHQWNWLPRYNWNIVESSIKHHKKNKETNTRFKYLQVTRKLYSIHCPLISIPLTRLDTSFPVVREITCINGFLPKGVIYYFLYYYLVINQRKTSLKWKPQKLVFNKFYYSDLQF